MLALCNYIACSFINIRLDIFHSTLVPTFKTGFRVPNHILNLCSLVVISQRLFCSKKNRCEMFVLKLIGSYTNYIGCQRNLY